MKFEEIIKKAGFELAELKELFIIEEIKPFFEDEHLKQELKVRLKTNKDAVDEYKQKLKKIIDSHSRKGVSHYEDSWDIRPSMLKDELGI